MRCVVAGEVMLVGLLLYLARPAGVLAVRVRDAEPSPSRASKHRSTPCRRPAGGNRIARGGGLTNIDWPPAGSSGRRQRQRVPDGDAPHDRYPGKDERKARAAIIPASASNHDTRSDSVRTPAVAPSDCAHPWARATG